MLGARAGVIPKGWHLPTADEWRMMFIRAGAKYAGIVDNEDAYAGAAKILKSADDWVLDKDFLQTVHAGERPDPFGFSVLPRVEYRTANMPKMAVPQYSGVMTSLTIALIAFSFTIFRTTPTLALPQTTSPAPVPSAA